MIACAKDLDKRYDFAGIEINMGCPSPKIMKNAAGSGMLRDKERTLSILKDLAESIDSPLSLKTRVGLTKDDVAPQFDFLIEAAKYVYLIGVHGRTYGQGHSGDVNWQFIYDLKDRLPETIVIGNGGLRTYQDAVDRLGNLDGNMIAQSAIGNPWVLTPHIPSAKDRIETIHRHLDLAVASEMYFQESVAKMTDTLVMPSYAKLQEIAADIPGRIGTYDRLVSVVEFRKYLFNYIKGLPDSKPLKNEIIKIRDYVGLKTVLSDYVEHLKQHEEVDYS